MANQVAIDQIDQFSTEMLNSAIKGINEAVAIKQREVDFWKMKAEALSVKYKGCLYCQSDENYMLEALVCKGCHRRLKEVNHA